MEGARRAAPAIMGYPAKTGETLQPMQTELRAFNAFANV